MVLSNVQTNLSSKRLLSESFGKAASHYDEFAHLQRHIGWALLNRLRDERGRSSASSNEAHSIADLGCGTGYFLTPLNDAFCPNGLFAADLSVDMLRVAKARYLKDASVDVVQKTAYLACDAESLPFSASSLDMIFSSLAIQWCENLDCLWAEVYQSLKPGGIFAFSTLLDGSLHELKDAWRQVDGEQHVNHFLSRDEYLESLSSTGFGVLEASTEEVSLEYSRVLDLMRDLKGVGAHNISQARPKAMTGKRKILQLAEAYETERMGNGALPATYMAGYFILQKPF